jgi:large subunit ribosomal protein L29
MKLYEIRTLTTEDLNTRLKEEKESLENLRFQKSLGQLENFKSIKNTKKLIARIHSILKEREAKGRGEVINE